MSTSNVTSPQSVNPFSPDQSTFDFLQFMGLDSTTSPYPSGDPGSAKSIDEENRASSSRGRNKSRVSRHTRGARSSSSGAHTATNGMDLDSNHGIVPFGPSQMMGMPKEMGQQSPFGLGASIGNGQDSDSSQAQLLQQQVSPIHDIQADYSSNIYICSHL